MAYIRVLGSDVQALRLPAPVKPKRRTAVLGDPKRRLELLSWALRQGDMHAFASAVRRVALERRGIKKKLRLAGIAREDFGLLGLTGKPVNMDVVERVLNICGYTMEQLQEGTAKRNGAVDRKSVWPNEA